MKKLSLLLAFASIALAQAPTVILPTDRVSDSRAVINANFLALYAGKSIDCSGTPGSFVVTVGNPSVCLAITSIPSALTLGSTLFVTGNTTLSGSAGFRADGTVAAPAYAFATDPTTGSYYLANNKWGFSVSAGEQMRLTAVGLSLNRADPTAALMLRQGGAAASSAPLKFVTGTNLGTPEAGAMEYNGASLFFTPVSTRLTVGLQVAVPGSAVTACTPGQWAATAGFHYDCIAANTWQRVAIATF